MRIIHYSDTHSRARVRWEWRFGIEKRKEETSLSKSQSGPWRITCFDRSPILSHKRLNCLWSKLLRITHPDSLIHDLRATESGDLKVRKTLDPWFRSPWRIKLYTPFWRVVKSTPPLSLSLTFSPNPWLMAIVNAWIQNTFCTPRLSLNSEPPTNFRKFTQ